MGDHGMSNYAHWADCALNHGGTECDMGVECGCSCPRDDNGDVKYRDSRCHLLHAQPRAAPSAAAAKEGK